MATILDRVTALIEELSWDELQTVVLRLAKENEHVQTALYQVVKDKERDVRLRQSIAWEPGDWLAARQHFQPIIEDTLSDCVDLFYDRYDDRDYRDYDSDLGRWDYSAGLEHLNAWLSELVEIAADGEWVDASVGLLLTLRQLNDWAVENGDEDLGGEDLEEECKSCWGHADALFAAIKNGAAPAANQSEFFHDLMDWIAGICTEDGDWATWREPLRLCLFSPAHYERLQAHLSRWEPAFLSKSPPEEPVDPDLVRWWVQASLDTGHEAEAKQAEAQLTAFDVETSASFARYYEQLDQMDDAIERLVSVIDSLDEVRRKSSNPSAIGYLYGYRQQANRFFAWLVDIFDRTERHTEALSWYIRWFESLPTLELFTICLDRLPPEERASQAEKWIAHVHALGGYPDLLIDMFLHLDDPDAAWQVYLEQLHPPTWSLSVSVRRLFETMKEHDPIRLVPILRQFAEKKIAEKNRSSYERAAQWLTELKSVYGELNQSDEWNHYVRSIRETYRRLPALQDELSKAKL